MIFIPAEERLTASRHEFRELRDYQRAVGGLIEAIDLDDPPMSFFANEEGKLGGLPINRRATALWWLHSPAAFGYDMLTGDAVLIGQPDRHGETQSAPAGFVSLLMDTQTFKVEVQTAGVDTAWYGNGRRFADYFAAALYAIDLSCRWAMVTRARVVAA